MAAALEKANSNQRMAKKERVPAGNGKAAVASLIEDNATLKTALQQIEKQFGEGSIMPLGGERTLEIQGIPTGSLSLDGAALVDAALVTVDAPLDVGPGGASIDGDLMLTPAAATTMGVAAGSVGLAVSGSASLGGALTVAFDGAMEAGQYTLLEADGGLGGTAFAKVAVTPPPGMTASVSYDDTHAYLVLATTVDPDLVFRDGFDGTPPGPAAER